MAKATFSQEKNKEVSLHRQIGLKLRQNLVKCYTWTTVCVVLRLGHFRKEIKSALEVLKRGAGEDGEDYFDRTCKKL